MTAQDARMLGVRLLPKTWRRIRRGVYVDRAAYEKLQPWKRYAVRVHAFVRAHPDAVLCLESAAALHGFPLFGETRDIHVLGDGYEKARHVGDVWVHTSEVARSVERVGGALVTSESDTVADLCRVLPIAKALSLADSAISPAQGGTVSIDDVCDLLDAQPNKRGLARARWVCAHADGLAESPGESISRAVILWSGFEEPELQREFHYEGYEDRADFHFRSGRVIGESDGWQKYALGDPARAAQKLADEKRREDRLRRNGHPFARWDLGEAMKVKPLCAALMDAGVPQLHPPQPAMLATLRSSPREVPRVPRETPKAA
ncbi:hypothetical protein [Microbacterium sp. NPDC057650]|uniref:hypothetical protein n=1 Tax=unclassified Microbacterium TaxID=2609290 RepID=UPI00366BCD6B